MRENDFRRRMVSFLAVVGLRQRTRAKAERPDVPVRRALASRAAFGLALLLPALAMALWVLCFGQSVPPAHAAQGGAFQVGVNYPWIAYGHDFGKNEWGHDGIITGGWTYQTYQDSQGFTDTRYSTDRAHGGRGSLRITADLVGGDPNRANGEVYLDLRNHGPRGVCVPVSLKDVTVSCWVWLPPGSAGNASAPNGVQLCFKSEGFYSYYSSWVNIEPGFEGRWVQFTARPSAPGAYRDAQFDETRVIFLCLKVAINSSSRATLRGQLYLDDYVVNTSPPIAYDFETLEVERDFQVIKPAFGARAQGVVRVFVFADGRAAPEFDANGEVQGFDEYFYQDFDALLASAQRQNLLVIPVLLDFWWCDAGRVEGGARLGGHSDVIRDPRKRQAFLDRALRPLIERYSSNPQIAGWDIINEPEWAIRETPSTFKMGDPVTLAEMREFVRQCGAVIHTRAGQTVTVGGARRQWLGNWKGLGLDLYQFHWYDHFEAEEPFPWKPVTELGLDKPCLIGEVPTQHTRYSAREFLQAARNGGYQGVLFWSYRAGDDFSNFDCVAEQIQFWCDGLPFGPRVRHAVFRPSTREWFILGPGGKGVVHSFGGSGDVPVPAAYLGGCSQCAVYRPSTGEWFIRDENGCTHRIQWGGPGDQPVPADYLGDGYAQVAVFRPSTGEWWIRDAAGKPMIWRCGAAGDVPVPADYFETKQAAAAVFRPSTAEWILRQKNGSLIRIPWGEPGDRPVPGNYLSKGRAMIAVFHPATSEWFIRNDDGSRVRCQWGSAGDVPVPGDYLGTGDDYIAVYRPSTGEWLVQLICGASRGLRDPWGGPGDLPVPSYYAAWPVP